MGCKETKTERKKKSGKELEHAKSGVCENPREQQVKVCLSKLRNSCAVKVCLCKQGPVMFDL